MAISYPPKTNSPDACEKHDSTNRKKGLEELQRSICENICKLMPDTTIHEKKVVAKKVLPLVWNNGVDITAAVRSCLKK